MTEQFVRYSSDVEHETPHGIYFIFLGDERDPVIGLQEEPGIFTIPEEPVRRRIHGLETFNVLRGGEYYFMPSLSALSWLAELGA